MLLSEYIVTPDEWPTGVEFTAADVDSNGTLDVFVRRCEHLSGVMNCAEMLSSGVFPIQDGIIVGQAILEQDK